MWKTCNTCVSVKMVVSWTVCGWDDVGGGEVVTININVVCAPAFFWWKTSVTFIVLHVIITSLAALPLLTASILVSLSYCWAVLLSLAVLMSPLLLLFLLFCFSGPVRIVWASGGKMENIFLNFNQQFKFKTDWSFVFSKVKTLKYNPGTIHYYLENYYQHN